jgi:hypothetical protein
MISMTLVPPRDNRVHAAERLFATSPRLPHRANRKRSREGAPAGLPGFYTVSSQEITAREDQMAPNPTLRIDTSPIST